MKLETLKKLNLPDSPGVYTFLGASRAGRRPILYIGKATSLRDRVRSYFSNQLLVSRGQLLVNMLEKAMTVKFQPTDSVLEAYILETNLIKKHHPPFNTIEKDDKSFNYVVITEEEFPRLRVVRGRDLENNIETKEIKKYFGPFPSGSTLRTALHIIRKIFPWRDDKCAPAQAKSTEGRSPDSPKGEFRGRPCFNRQLGLCPGVCTGEISKEEYSRLIRHLVLFFEGKKGVLVKELKREMNLYAKRQEFEKAQEIRGRLFALNHIQDVALIKEEVSRKILERPLRFEAYDIAHISGTSMVGVMVVVEGGEAKKSDYRKFKIRSVSRSNDPAALKEVLTRRLRHVEWQAPEEHVEEGNLIQRNVAREALRAQDAVRDIEVVAVVKDERHKPREILGPKGLVERHKKEIILANQEAHRFAIAFHKKRRSKAFLP